MLDFIKYWEKQRKQGRLKYSIKMGFPFGLIVTLIKEWNTISEALQGNLKNISNIYPTFICAFLGGITASYLIWWWNEEHYKKEKQSIKS